MHGGRIAVASEVDKGTTFTVSHSRRAPCTCPRIASAPLEPDVHGDRTDAVRAGSPAMAARRIAANAAPRPAGMADAGVSDARVLIADDNADMREYIDASARGSLVGGGGGGRHDGACRCASQRRPDVIVADVMMPGLDGFELLRALRADPATRTVAVVLVSARAGEEARIEGLDAGADDYIVKPFAARELVARVQAQIVRSRMRSLEEAHAARLMSIFEHTPVGVAILRGPTHVFEFANREYLGMVSHRALVGKPVREALPELEGQGLFELLDAVYGSGEAHVGRSDRVMLDRGGAQPAETFFDFVYQPLTEDGRVTGIAAVCFEVTELAKARRAAELANRAKDEFLAMLGHELRNPLAPILTALQLMNLRGVTGADRERQIIERQVKHVVRLVDDLLDVSRITRGTVQLRKERLRLPEVITKAIEIASPSIDGGRHTLQVDLAGGVEVDGDAARLAQVFANLLNNAAKYTDPAGSIRVRTERVGDTVQVHVSDTGRGIALEMLPRVFDLFVQERQDLGRAQGGLGIGLAIVRSLVEAHGGAVRAQSAGQGRGATFTVTLPWRSRRCRLSRSIPRRPRSSTTPGSRILLVDDNQDAATVLGDSLRALGHDVLVAHDGPTALVAANECRPQVALLDLGLPVMDGFELAERLRGEVRVRAISRSSPLPGTRRKSIGGERLRQDLHSTWRNLSTCISSTRSSGRSPRMPRPPRRTPPDVNSTKYGSYTAAPFSEVLKRAIALVLAAAAAGTLGGIALNACWRAC